MAQDLNQSDNAATKKSGVSKNLIGGLLIAAVAFSVGIGVGDGKISLGSQDNQNASLPDQLDYSTVSQMYGVLRQDYDGKLDQEKLLEGMKEGLAEATGDPYTEYFTASAYKEFDNQLNGQGFSGIGAELGQDKDKNLIVVSPISGTPAAQAGLRPQDIIAEIDGNTTSGLSVDEAVTKIRGKKGTTVKLTLIRNKSESIPVEITRDDIRIPSVETKMLDDTTGYMRVSTFGENTGKLALEQAQDLKQKGAKSIVLDLRNNPGGVVDSAIEIASLWLPKGKLVMEEKRGDTVVKTYTSEGAGTFQGLPTTVLINQGSASASEIVAGALKDGGAATLVGEKSYGKGVVQGIKELEAGAFLKVTVASWYRPNGSNINKKGIEPDQKVKISDEDAAASKDTQLEAAQNLLK